MAIAVVAFVKETPASQAAQSQTLTFVPGNAIGNLLVVAIAVRSTVSPPSVASIDDTGGNVWAFEAEEVTGNRAYDMWYCLTTAVAGTVTIHTDKATNTTGASCLEFSNAAGWRAAPGTGDVLAKATGTSATPSSGSTSPNGTLYIPEVVVGFVGQNGAGRTFSLQTAGFTPKTLVTSGPVGVKLELQSAYKLKPNDIGLETYGCTSSASDAWGAQVASFVPLGSIRPPVPANKAANQYSNAVNRG